jgi:hypothetical protein
MSAFPHAHLLGRPKQSGECITSTTCCQPPSLPHRRWRALAAVMHAQRDKNVLSSPSALG